jgi:hypothetical protein
MADSGKKAVNQRKSIELSFLPIIVKLSRHSEMIEMNVFPTCTTKN